MESPWSTGLSSTKLKNRVYSTEVIYSHQDYDSRDEKTRQAGGRTGVQCREMRESGTSCGRKQRIGPEYFHIILGELRIYLNEVCFKMS